MPSYIALTQGQRAVVDDCNFELLNRFTWRASKSGKTYYAQRHCPSIGSRAHMHHDVLFLAGIAAPRVDHIDGDGLNNQLSNLRPATNAENMWNRGRTRKNSSGYKGVYAAKEDGLWRAVIRCNGKQHHLGYFDSAEEAAAAYDQAAVQLHGQFARTNGMESLIPSVQKHRKRPRRTSSGHPGISLDKATGRYCARVGSEWIGRFSTLDEAIKAQLAAVAESPLVD
jgi:hypothetical protein